MHNIQMISNLTNQLFKRSVFFITPDFKRGLGLEGILPEYHIICGYFDSLIPMLRKQGVQIFCLEEMGFYDEKKFNNTGKIMENEETVSYINKKSKETPVIMYFKPSKKIDYVFDKHRWIKAGNNYDLNECFENKIYSSRLFKKYFPEVEISSLTGRLNKLSFSKLIETFSLPILVQFGHGWAGKTTFLIKSENEFQNLYKRYPETVVKVSKFLEGFSVLNNCCIYQDKILVSPPAVQISAINKLYPNPFVTCGRQWPAKFISAEQGEKISGISHKVGSIMQKKGYKGFFGLDFLVEKATGKIYLSEINARLTASSSFFTKLELGCGKIPLMLYHLASFLDLPLPNFDPDYPEFTGSQIIFREGGGQPKKHDPEFFGLFSPDNKKSIFINDKYQPDKLNDKEYIFLKRAERPTNSIGQETARIETRMEALKTPQSLSSWVDQLVS